MTPDPALAQRFAAFFDRTPPGRLALAVSGGPDSMAMLALAATAFPGRTIAATVDHGLRADAAAECAMVAEACAALGVPHATLVADAPLAGASLQARARALRYRLLIGWARAEGADALATAHQADDQAETLLMRAARGAGLSGLAGVRARRAIAGAPPLALVRPLLDWRRAELRALVRRLGLPFIDDPANDDPRHDRTRFRRLLHANEWLDPPRLARAAAHLAEADADLRWVADGLWAERARERRGALEVNMADLPRGLRRRLTQRAIRAVHGGAEGSEDGAIEPLLDALEGGKAATQGDVLVRPAGALWRFRPAPPRRT